MENNITILAAVLGKIGLLAVDAGGIASARFLEQLAHLNIQLAVAQGNGTSTAFAYLK
jgi:predicted dinucleotide-binding enzyme